MASIHLDIIPQRFESASAEMLRYMKTLIYCQCIYFSERGDHYTDSQSGFVKQLAPLAEGPFTTRVVQRGPGFIPLRLRQYNLQLFTENNLSPFAPTRMECGLIR
jgi:hypothetical protein